MSSIFEKRISLFQDILAISRQQLNICQRENLNSEDMEKLSDLINQRQKCINEIDHINSSLSSMTVAAEGKIAYVADNAGSSDSFYALNDDLQKVMETIRHNDDSCRKLLQRKSRELASLIKTTRVSRQAVDAYNQKISVNEAWFIDRKK